MERQHSFLPLYVTNFFGTLNDNFLKTLASFTVIGWLSDERVKFIAMGVTAGALVLPYILCSPLADRLTAVWRKKKIVRIAKWAELPIMAVAIAGFAFHSPWLLCPVCWHNNNSVQRKRWRGSGNGQTHRAKYAHPQKALPQDSAPL